MPRRTFPLHHIGKVIFVHGLCNGNFVRAVEEGVLGKILQSESAPVIVRFEICIVS